MADTRDPSFQHGVFENQEICRFPRRNYYGFPEMKPTQTKGNRLVRFADNKYISDEEKAVSIAHFYYEDYKFMVEWRQPKKHLNELRKFKAVISPDFSLYTDFPRALQILSCYRRQWCGAYWQYKGIDVIPDVVWGDRASFEWCFDGLPRGGTVAVSTVGVRNNPDWNGTKGHMFEEGYNEMMVRLNPSAVIIYGDMIQGLAGNIINVPSYYGQRREGWKHKR